MSGQRTSGGSLLAGAAIVVVGVAVAITLGSNMPSRMPPDPHENLRVVRFEAEWRGSPVDRYMVYGTGSGSDDAYRDESRMSPWSAALTAEPGDRVWLLVSPDWSKCRIYVDDELVAEHEDEDCDVEATVP